MCEPLRAKMTTVPRIQQTWRTRSGMFMNEIGQTEDTAHTALNSYFLQKKSTLVCSHTATFRAKFK